MIDSVQQDLGRSKPFSPSTLSTSAANSSQVPAANLTYAYAGFGAVLGILFGVATAATLHQGTQQVAELKSIIEPAIVLPQAEAGVVHADFVMPEEKDMGVAASRITGLKGHLFTSWSEKPTYRLTVEPGNSSQIEAFAETVSNPPHPLWVDLQLKSAAGSVLCDQGVVLKFDPVKAAGQNPSRLTRLVAQEKRREQWNDVFRNDLDPAGKVKSISSQGTLSCSKEQYDNAAFWSFGADFPSLNEFAKTTPHRTSAPVLAKAAEPVEHPYSKPAASHADVSRTAIAKVAVAVPAPTTVAKAAPSPKPAPAVAAPAADAPVQATAEVSAAQFHFQIEGDDEIVDFDAGQKSLETSAGKTFFVNETLAASSVASWLDMQANVHYRCDETSTCTLSLASVSTVLHATMRSHHSSLAQLDVPAMTLAQSSAPDQAGPQGMGH